MPPGKQHTRDSRLSGGAADEIVKLARSKGNPVLTGNSLSQYRLGEKDQDQETF